MMSATSTQLVDFYRWGFPNSPIQIHLGLDVVSGIRRQIEDCEIAPDALSQCGLLIGTSEPGITSILNFEPLETLDTASLGAAMLSASGEVVGFYRTTAAGSSSMSAEDRALAAKFPQPSAVFLQIETTESSIGNARFCFWGEGELFDWPVMVFPFAAEALASRSRPEARYTELQPVAASAPLPVPPPEHRQKSMAPARQARQTTGRPWLLWVMLAALACLSLSLGALAYFRPGSRLPVAAQPAAAASTEVKKTSLGLAVEKRGNGLLVSWDGNAPIVSKANFGMLLIRGSGVSRDVPLTTDELRAGGSVYTLASDELRFQLNIVAGEQVVREFLTVVRPLTPESPARPPTRLASASSGNSNAAVPSPPAKSEPAPQPLAEIRQFEPVAPSQSAAAPPLGLDEPPAAGGLAPVNTRTLSVPNPTSVSVPSPSSVSVPNQPSVSVPNQPSASVPAPVEVQGKEVPVRQMQSDPVLAAEARPPVAIHRVVPVVPILLRGQLWNTTVVDVRMSVDASGSVVKAEAVPKPGLHPVLRDEAVKAARWWKFQPASFNGHPVPAEIVVQFNFAASR